MHIGNINHKDDTEIRWLVGMPHAKTGWCREEPLVQITGPGIPASRNEVVTIAVSSAACFVPSWNRSALSSSTTAKTASASQKSNSCVEAQRSAPMSRSVHSLTARRNSSGDPRSRPRLSSLWKRFARLSRSRSCSRNHIQLCWTGRLCSHAVATVHTRSSAAPKASARQPPVSFRSALSPASHSGNSGESVSTTDRSETCSKYLDEGGLHP
jgi:hypothetical protein